MIDIQSLPIIQDLYTGDEYTITGLGFDYLPEETILTFSEDMVDRDLSWRHLVLTNKTPTTATFRVYARHGFSEPQQAKILATPLNPPRTIIPYIER